MKSRLTWLVILNVILILLISISFLPRFEDFERPDIQVSIPELEMTKEVIVKKKMMSVSFDIFHEPKYSPFVEYSRFLSLFKDSESYITIIDEEIKNLSSTGVLIVISPNVTYTDEEVTTIEKAVKDGMTLVLLGERETTKNINKLAVKFGVLFNNEKIYDLTNYWLFYRNPILGEFVKAEDSGNLTLGLERLTAHDACVLTAVKPADSIIYTKETASSSSGVEKRKIPFAAIAKIDMGKVLAVCDTDIFSNKNIEMFGNLIFAGNIVDWS